MIRSDRKVAGAALKLTRDYSKALSLDSSGVLCLCDSPDKAIALKIPVQDALEAVDRLVAKGYFRIHTKYWGGYSFTITSYLNHRFAFFWDRFTRKFLFGYIAGIVSGVIVTVLGGLISAYLRVRWGI